MARTYFGILAAACLALCGCGSSGSGSGGGGGGGGGTTASPAVLNMEDDTHLLINNERQTHSLGQLSHDLALRQVARAHSEDMARRNFFAHTNPDGLDPFDRMSLAGITYVAAGENIAWNKGYADPAQVAVTGWMNSPGHRANILNSQYTQAGLGAAQSADGSWYFTQVFSRPYGAVVIGAQWRANPSISVSERGGASWIR